jgi:hypothetical protein
MRIRIGAGVGRFVLGLFCLALLTSIGGAGIVAAPVTLPVLWLAARDASRVGRFLLDLVAALTAAELMWAVAFRAFGDASVWTRLLPLLGFVLVAAGYPTTQRRVLQPVGSSPDRRR